MDRTGCFVAVALLVLSGCGGGDGSGDTPPSDIGTLAYVATECQGTAVPGCHGASCAAAFFSERQTLHILHGDRDVTVMETPGVGPLFVAPTCTGLTGGRFGGGSIAREAFQAVAVSPDGNSVVFEVTDDFSPLPLHLPPDQKGIFFVRADGSGLRPLGPPSRLPSFFRVDSGFTFVLNGVGFSPDGRMITFASTGPDAAGNEAAQVMTLDVKSAQRRQVTHLPAGVPPADRSLAPGVLQPTFIDNQTIGFFTDAYGLTPTGNFATFTVSLTDGAVKEVPLPVTLEGSSIVSTFVITGDKPAAIELNLPGQPKNDLLDATPRITEVFAVDGLNLLQLTNFQREDTGGEMIDGDRQTVYFNASADPFGTNPSENCQIFSIDRLGGSLRQLTRFSEAQHSSSGCFFYDPPIVGCAVDQLRQDSRTRTLVFYSSCDPLGTNPDGGQLFAMRPDGSGLRQLTHTQGLVVHADLSVLGELPGPFAYGPYAP